MSYLTPEFVLPATLIAGAAAIFATVGIRTLFADERAYEHARRLTGTPKRAVLGLVSPEVPCELGLDVERGFAISYSGGQPVIVPNGKLPIDKLT